MIDVNESEFITSSLPPDLTIELELMNIISDHKIPLAAFKSIYEWAVGSQKREGFDFTTMTQAKTLRNK